MQAIVVDEQHPQRPLNWREVPDPSCGPGEVLVDVRATAVNRADLLQRAGQYPPPPDASSFLGLEMAGIVTAVGPQAGDWRPGDRVCALLAGGGYATQVAVPYQQLMRIPAEWDFTYAAAIPEVFLTAHVNLFMEAHLSQDETVLIHGGGSGVGTAAVQLARAAGCQVLVTAGSDAKIERCVELGAEFGVNYRQRDFADAILERTDGVDVILDIAGAAYLEPNLRLLKSRGRLVVIALLSGREARIDLGTVLSKRLRLIGSLLRSRPAAEKGAIVRHFQSRFWPHLKDGRIKPIIHAVLPITRAAEAHGILEENRNTGKVVLTVDE